MNLVTLGFHDVVDELTRRGDDVRPSPEHYALTRARFREHLKAVAERGVSLGPVDAAGGGAASACITFDDGGIGGYECAADELERFGWRGHFLITTDWIGRAGFMERHHLRELAGRGHRIGSHTCSHPARMSALSREQLLREWGRSCGILADILGAPVVTASVSDGYYSRAVGECAAECGIRFLFNSEPTARVTAVGECGIYGRFPIFAASPPSLSGDFVGRERMAAWKVAVSWKAKKALKAMGGVYYLRARNALLGRSR